MLVSLNVNFWWLIPLEKFLNAKIVIARQKASLSDP